MERDYLLEIGCEEIPAGFVGPALWFGGQQFEGMLKKARLSFRKVDIYGTPRRLTYVIRDLEDRQAASKETVMGPPKSVGLDAAGKPTKAALGFAKSQGIDVSALAVFPTDRGDYLGFVREEAARPVQEILPKIVSDFLPAIPFKKSMRWADLDVRFARPVHWIVSLYGDEVLPFSFGNVDVGADDLRAPVPRPRAPSSFPRPPSTPGGSRRPGCSWTSKTGRGGSARGIREAEKRIGMKWVEDEPLVETVANLVEYPVVMVGRFEEKYLSLPQGGPRHLDAEQPEIFRLRGCEGRPVPGVRLRFEHDRSRPVGRRRRERAGPPGAALRRRVLLRGRPEEAPVRPDRGAEKGPFPGGHGNVLGKDRADGGDRRSSSPPSVSPARRRIAAARRSSARPI